MTRQKPNLAASVAARLLNRARADRRRLPDPPRRASASSASCIASACPACASASCSRARCCSGSGRISPTGQRATWTCCAGATARSRRSAPTSRRSARRAVEPDAVGVRRRRDRHRGDPRRGRVRWHAGEPARPLRHGAADAADRHGAGRLGLAARRSRAPTRRCSTFRRPTCSRIRAEAVVAEKLEAMVVLGDRNSRIKDFFDLHHLASRFQFDRATLAEAVRRTFARRRTPDPGGGADRADSGLLGKRVAPAAGARVRPARGPDGRAGSGWRDSRGSSAVSRCRYSAICAEPSRRLGPGRREGPGNPGSKSSDERGDEGSKAGRARAGSSRIRRTRTPASSGWGRFRRIGR